MRLWNFLEGWLSYSIRRQLLDADLESLRDRMSGCVLEIGNGRRQRRGKFRPPITEAKMWMYLDMKKEIQPHLCANIEALPLKDAEFNTVICLEVMEYVPDFQTALKEMHFVLKPGGTLILTTPFLHRIDCLQDYWRFTEHALRYLLVKAGFEVKEIRPQGGPLAVVVNILKYIIYAIPRPIWRQMIALVAYFPLMIILWLDSWSTKFLPILRTFSTGYLVLTTQKPIEM